MRSKGSQSISHHFKEGKKSSGMEAKFKSQIIPIPMGTSNAYIVTNGKQAILIDAGDRKKEQQIIDALRQAPVSPGNIQLIILTHAHFDHCGNSKALRDITGGRIVVHETEVEWLRNGFCKLPKGTNMVSKMLFVLGTIIGKRICEYPPVIPDIAIADKFDLKGYGIDGYILPTPGHTSGSLSVIIEDKHAFVGDTFFNVSEKTVYPPYADDQKELLRTWEKLFAVGCEAFYPGHGRPFTRDEFEKNLLERKKKGKRIPS
ncbi:MAG: MBL fold metallo-hydrolase [Dehalococcoidia bacterium]|nr:MBL fold metallo-hydrolase [Dehalococcoidia bacterium]